MAGLVWNSTGTISYLKVRRHLVPSCRKIILSLLIADSWHKRELKVGFAVACDACAAGVLHCAAGHGADSHPSIISVVSACSHRRHRHLSHWTQLCDLHLEILETVCLLPVLMTLSQTVTLTSGEPLRGTVLYLSWMPSCYVQIYSTPLLSNSGKHSPTAPTPKCLVFKRLHNRYAGWIDSPHQGWIIPKYNTRNISCMLGFTYCTRKKKSEEEALTWSWTPCDIFWLKLLKRIKPNPIITLINGESVIHFVGTLRGTLVPHDGGSFSTE